MIEIVVPLVITLIVEFIFFIKMYKNVKGVVQKDKRYLKWVIIFFVGLFLILLALVNCLCEARENVGLFGDYSNVDFSENILEGIMNYIGNFLFYIYALFTLGWYIIIPIIILLVKSFNIIMEGNKYDIFK